MELGELIDHFRTVHLDDISQQVDGQPDEMFGVESIVRLFNNGQDEFARKTWCLLDDETNTLSTINLDADAANGGANYTGQKLVRYSTRIVRILRARFSDSDVPLAITGYGYSEPTAAHRFSMEPFDVNVVHTLSPGRPAALFLDAQTRFLKFDRPLDAATAALDLKMRVVHMPWVKLQSDLVEASPEIPEEYHLGLCDYVGKELLKGPNLEAEGRRLRALYATDWAASITAGRREFRRKTQGPIAFKFGGWANN